LPDTREMWWNVVYILHSTGIWPFNTKKQACLMIVPSCKPSFINGLPKKALYGALHYSSMYTTIMTKFTHIETLLLLH